MVLVAVLPRNSLTAKQIAPVTTSRVSQTHIELVTGCSDNADVCETTAICHTQRHIAHTIGKSIISSCTAPVRAAELVKFVHVF